MLSLSQTIPGRTGDTLVVRVPSHADGGKPDPGGLVLGEWLRFLNLRPSEKGVSGGCSFEVQAPVAQ